VGRPVPLHATVCRHVALRATVCRYVALHATVRRYVALHVTVFRYVALHATVCRHVALHATVCRHVALHATDRRYVALHATVCRYVALHATVCRYVALHATVCRHVALRIKHHTPGSYSHSPVKMEQTQCSETSAIKHHTPGHNPKYYTQYCLPLFLAMNTMCSFVFWIEVVWSCVPGLFIGDWKVLSEIIWDYPTFCDNVLNPQSHWNAIYQCY
jgi:hypothetical protein